MNVRTKFRGWLQKVMDPNVAFSVLAYAATLLFLLFVTLFAPLVVKDTSDAPKPPVNHQPRGR